MSAAEARPEWQTGFIDRIIGDLNTITDLARVSQNGEPGLLLAAAQEKITHPNEGVTTLTPPEVYDVIVPPPRSGRALPPRWQLVESAGAAILGFAERNQARIFEAAEALRMRMQSCSEDLSAVNPAQAVFVVEGGANLTSIVRRVQAESAMQVKHGDDLSEHTLYQFGTNRLILPELESGAKNQEYLKIRAQAHEYLPDGLFTEFEANLATAQADGYAIVGDRLWVKEDLSESDFVVQRAVRLKHAADAWKPKLQLLQPSGKGLYGGLDALHTQLRDEGEQSGLSNAQLVVATNGQYRRRSEQTVMSWALKNNIEIAPPVAVGDEPGDFIAFRGNPRAIEVAPRNGVVYLNELAILGRTSLQLLQGLETGQ